MRGITSADRRIGGLLSIGNNKSAQNSYWFPTVVCVILSRTPDNRKNLIFFWVRKLHYSQFSFFSHPLLSSWSTTITFPYDHNLRMGTTKEARDVNASRTSGKLFFFFFNISLRELLLLTIAPRYSAKGPTHPPQRSHQHKRGTKDKAWKVAATRRWPNDASGVVWALMSIIIISFVFFLILINVLL